MRGIPRRNEDAATLAAVKFQQALARCTNDIDRHMLMEREPGIYHAYLVRRPAETQEGSIQRWSLEARLLTNESDDDIADKIGCTPTIIEWYERLFFNVREKLRARDYIMTTVIGPAVHTGMTDRDYDILWKVFGYIYGPIVLDAFMTTSTSIGSLVETGEEVNDRFDVDISATIRRKAMICARTYVLNGFTQEGMMNIYSRFRELEQAKDSGGQAKDTFMNTIQVVINKMPWSNGDGIMRPDLPDVSRPLDQKLLCDYDTGRAELRTDELLAVAAGRDLSDRASLQDMKYPEPANANPKAE